MSRNIVRSILFLCMITSTAYSEGFKLAIEKSLPRVVKLYGVGVGKEAGYGSGVLVSEDGMVLTVFSLLIDARTIRAVDADGNTYEADVLYRDRTRQLAMLKLKPIFSVDLGGAWYETQPDQKIHPEKSFGPFPYYDLSCENDPVDKPCGPQLFPGDWVMSTGNAFKVADGAEKLSIAHGVFSTRTPLDARRRVKDFPYTGDVLVIDAITSNPGAPGSALVNLEGELIGLIGREVVSNMTHTHLNYALPRDVIHEFYLESIAFQPGAVAANFLPRKNIPREIMDVGIRISKAGYQTVLPFVDRVKRNSPAANAGVRKDDLILSINNRNISSIDDYHKRMRSTRSGDPIDLVLRRGRHIITVVIQAEEP